MPPFDEHALIADIQRKVAVLERAQHDFERRITQAEGHVATVAEDVKTIKESQVDHRAQQTVWRGEDRAKLNTIEGIMLRLDERAEREDEDERTEARAVKQRSAAWSDWLRDQLDAKTIAIILSILAGYAGIQMSADIAPDTAPQPPVTVEPAPPRLGPVPTP